MDNSNFINDFNFIFKEIQGSSGWSLDRDRPYDGQSHTDNGIRGKTLVQNLTMRDISDCMVKAFLTIGNIERENPIHDDIYNVDLNKIDPGALIKCTLCEVEKMMGIFPNIPKQD